MKTKNAVVACALALVAAQSFAVEHTEVTKVARLPFLRGMGFDGYYGGRNGTFMTDASMYKKLAAMGFDHIRVPIDFRDYSDYDESTGVCTLKETTSGWFSTGPGFSTFDKIIDYAEAAGLYIYLDFHGLDKFPVESVASSNQFISIWKAVAERYKDRSNKVIFEIWNEPHWELEPEPICAVEKDVVKEIRKTNPTRLILYDIPGGGGSWPLGHKAHDLLEMPENDNNIAVVSHQYTPGRFTHQGEQWVDNPENTAIGIDEQYCTGTNNNVAQYSTPRKELLKDLQNARDWTEWSDVPQVINEFNVSNKLLGQGNFSKADVIEWMSIVSRFCESNNIPWAPWSCRNSFGGVGGMDCCNSSWVLYDYIKPGLFPDLKTTDDFSVSDYPKSIDITFSGYTGSSTLVNFPVLVKLSPDSIPGFKYSDFTRADGYDLCFTDASGNLIPHEIDTWNPGGVSTVWVKVPSLTSSTKIVARYGCAKPIVHKVESVWDSDYVGVWHLGERKLPLADSSNESRDVTSRDGDGIAFGSAGVVGGSVDFGATGSSRCVNMDDHRLLDGFTNMTVEAWTKQAAHSTNAGILSKRTGNGSQMSYFMYDNGSGTTMKYSANGTSSVDSNVTLQPELGRWNHQAYSLDATKTSSNSKGYLNGVLKGTGSVSLSGGKVFAGNAELHVGNFQSDDSRNFPGRIDEVRVSKCVRSADWVKASYDTVEKCDFAVYSLQGAGTQNPTLYIPVDRGATSTLDASEIKSWTTKIVKDGDGTLVAAPVTSSSITNLSVWGGTVKLASSASASVVSKIGELEFSADTGLDLSGKSYTVARLKGAPSVQNAATFTVTGSWTVEEPGAMSVSGALAFGSGAVLALADESKFSSVGYSGIAIATATGGITGMPVIASDEFRLKLSADGKSLLLCSNTPDSADWTAFAKSMTVAFGGVQSGVTLADFPVLVKLSTAIEGFSYADFQLPNGGDLRFSDADGNLLPHEIDTWNPSGVSTVWVKVPTLNSSTTIKAHYGCRHPVGALDSKDVWDDDYVGVWHLGESALPMKESSETSSDFKVASGAKIKYAQAGAVGGSVDFRSANSDSALLAPDHPALDGFSKFTVELWMNQVKKQYAGILSKRVRYEFKNSYYLYHTGNYVSLYAATNAASPAAWAFNQNADTNQWSHLAFAVDMTTSSGNIHGYTNGVGKAVNVSFRSDTVPDTTTTLCLGNIQNGSWLGNRFNGRIDEVRISKCVRSAAWIKATHDTIANANFATYTMDNDVPPPEPQRILYVPVAAGVTNTLNAALVTSYITNIVKQGAGTLVASPISSYAHAITVEAGVLQGGANAGDFGTDGVVIDVKSGASLALRGATTNGLASAVLSGKTVNLYGAKEANTRGKIYVYNDATTTLGPNVTIRLKDADSVLYLDCASWRAFYISSGTIDLGGRKLSVSSNYRRFETGATVVNGGTLELDHTEFNVDNDSRIPTFSGTGTLKTNYAINLKKLVSAPGWTLSGNQVSLHGNINRKPTTTDYPVWSGPVAFSGSSKLAEYAGASSGTSNTVFNLKGAVSGSGSLLIGPGWLNLHSAANSYTGKVKVTGQAVGAVQPILAGGGGIGLWNGAACFPSASSVTFTNTARLAFMDNTACTVPNVKFIALAGETQSISGGVHTARSTIAGITKTGAGMLVVDSPAQITGLADIQAGTLKIAYRSDTTAQTQEAMLEPMPQFSSLKFASGTVLDLSDNVGMVLSDLEGAPCVTNSGMFGIGGKWKLDVPGERLLVTSELATLGGAGGVLCFLPGATFDLADEAAFRTAASGVDGLLVAEAAWILDPAQLAGQVSLPAPVSTLGAGWSMAIGKDSSGTYGRGLYLRYSDPSASGYAAWIAGKGLSGSSAAFERETNGIKNGVRYAFDIDPAVATVGEPIIKVVRDANGNPVVEARELAAGRDDVTFGVLATENLTDWSNATLVPMKKFETDGFWKPTASENNSSYVFPSKMFFKYTVEVE